jgi:hypothetical protein
MAVISQMTTLAVVAMARQQRRRRRRTRFFKLGEWAWNVKILPLIVRTWTRCFHIYGTSQKDDQHYTIDVSPT